MLAVRPDILRNVSLGLHDRSIKGEEQFKGLSTDIEAAGFSDPPPPHRPPVFRSR